MAARRWRSRAAAILVVGVLALPSPGPAAATTAERLEQARHQAALAQQDLGVLLSQYRSLAIASDEATMRSYVLRLKTEQAQADELGSRDAFVDAIRHAYMQGASSDIEAVLGSASIADLEARLPFAHRTLDRSREQARLVAGVRAEVAALANRAVAAQRDAFSKERALTEVRVQIEARLEALREQIAVAERALASEAADRWQRSFEQWLATQHDIDHALAERRRARGEQMFHDAESFLGPRADCSIPAGLRPTGQALHGEASWYGTEFAGNNTAAGAVFDPDRFTVAHKTLPFGVFLLVRLGDRCVVSLLNDRGPYVDGRILDLSRASARAIGVGVNDVDATVLVRR